MQLGVSTIAVPRIKDLGESQDDQSELVDALAAEGLVVPLHDVNEFETALSEARTLKAAKVSDNRLLNHVADTVRSLLKKAT